MYNNRYDERTFRKFNDAMPHYAKRMFRKIADAENVLALETKDHLRTPPAKDIMKPISTGSKWGGEYMTMWLTFSYTVPEEYAGRQIYVMHDTSAVEIFGFTNGHPTGIINSKNDFIGGGHSAYLVTNSAKAGETYEVSLECYAGHTCYGCDAYSSYDADDTKPNSDFIKDYNGLTVCVLEEAIRDAIFDVCTVVQLARLKEGNFASIKARECVFDAFPYLIQDVKRASYDELIAACKKLSEAVAPALEKSSGELSRGYYGAIGHSHMDTAWLWPMSETVRKCARTYAKALSCMEIYPDYKFVQSSALHLSWMKDYYPELFERIKARVAEGRYEPNGGVWVECDCNVTGGEAMIRQFLYGQRYTEREVGYRSDTFWLPDTFGYSAAIPQIMQGTGVKYFCTTKIGWNDCNEFPEQTFVWRGLDGSEVLTHFNTICDIPDPSHLEWELDNIPDKRISGDRLMTYGFGDGGGGPTFGMMEFFKRTKDLPGLPVIESSTVGAFMDRLNKKRDRYPVYDGELYLEFHRGTLTTNHMVKQLNRQAEIALHNMELANVLAGGAVNERHEELYKILLKNQFHDILPGTCIDKVYEIEVPEMQRMIADTKAVTEGYIGEMTDADAGKLSLVNPLSFDNKGVFTLDGTVGVDGCDAQTYTDADGNAHTDVAASIDAMASTVVTLTGETKTKSAFRFDGKTLETPFYTTEIDENGYISSLIDKENGREVANKAGQPLGTLWFGEDFPTCYDNWEIEDDIFLKLDPVKADSKPTVVSDGAVEFRFRTTYALGDDSRAYVDTVFYAGSKLIQYEMKLDWQARHRLLKAGFDVNIRSAFVKNEVQFGHIDRPTTRNTTLEKAKFEVCNHKWSDISETNYGVALFNDCKYGMSCERGDMRLTLHKGAVRPAANADFGTHYMKYAILPHTGAFSAETVVQPAYAFNYKPIVASGVASVPSLFSLDKPNIIAEAVKNAEDNENAYVIRLYECERSTTRCTLALNGAKKAYVTNMLEEIEEELPITDGKVTLNFRPFEIKTVMVER